MDQVLFGTKGKPLLYSEGQYAKLASLTIGEPLPEGLDSEIIVVDDGSTDGTWNYLCELKGTRSNIAKVWR